MEKWEWDLGLNKTIEMGMGSAQNPDSKIQNPGPSAIREPNMKKLDSRGGGSGFCELILLIAMLMVDSQNTLHIL